MEFINIGSVILPRKSTVNLPDALGRRSGHATGMNLAAILRRIERRLKLLKLSANAASKEAHKPDAIRNMRRAVKEGRNGVNMATLEALAPVLRTTLPWLLEEKGDEEIATEDHAKKPPVVQLIGYVGAGAKTHYYDVGPGALEEVAAPQGATPDTVAVEIRGDSLGGVFNHWLVYYDDVRRPVTEDLIGRLCVVGLHNGQTLIKELRAARNGRFRLISATEDPMEDVEVEWAAAVKQMTPK